MTPNRRTSPRRRAEDRIATFARVFDLPLPLPMVPRSLALERRASRIARLDKLAARLIVDARDRTARALECVA